MKSVNTWFASVSVYAIVVALVVAEFDIPAFAQSKSQNRNSQFSEQQLDDLQEFARQFREDLSLQPPASSDFEPQAAPKSGSNQIPSFGAGYSIKRQDKVQQDQEKVFDPFSDLRRKEESRTDDQSELDPSPDPPVDEKPNQAPQTRVPTNSNPQDQPNPFSDDRAVDTLRDLEQTPRSLADPTRSQPRRNENQNWDRIPKPERIDPEVLRQWELPPDAIVPGEGSQDNLRQSPPAQSAQPRQPRSSVEPYYPQQDPNQFPAPQYQPEQAQPNYWAQPDQSAGYPQQHDYPYQGDGYQANPYQVQPNQQHPDRHGYANGHTHAGEGTYFENAHNQWGVAGDVGCNSCGISDCGFDCEELEFYLAGYGASTYLEDLISGSNSLLVDNGGGWGIALGRRQGLNLRTELEYGWRSNNVIGFDEDGLLSDMTGKIKAQSGMANAYWEFVNFPTRCIKPYVGTGLGFARFDVDLRDEFGDSLTLERSKDSSFAYQFMGGINYQPFSTVDLFIEYRLFRTDSFQLDTESGFASGKYEYQTSNLVGGLRWKF